MKPASSCEFGTPGPEGTQERRPSTLDRRVPFSARFAMTVILPTWPTGNRRDRSDREDVNSLHTARVISRVRHFLCATRGRRPLANILAQCAADWLLVFSSW